MPIEEIEGYNEFMRDTARIEKEFPDAMRVAAVEYATEWVALARGNATGKYAGEAAAAFIVSNEGVIENSSPVFFGSEFGGQARPETMQFPPYNGRTGYWFYPARRNNEEHLALIWDKGVEVAMRDWNRNG